MKRKSKIIFAISTLAVALPLIACSSDTKKERVERSPYDLCFANSLVDPHDSGKLKSGFEADHRGADLRKDFQTEDVDFITDVRTDEKSRILRRFNMTNSGVIDFSFILNYWNNADGNVIRIGNTSGKDLYYLEVLHDYFFITMPNGRREGIYKYEESRGTAVKFRIFVDFDLNNVTTFINNVDCGTYPLLAKSFDFISFESSVSTTNVTQVMGLQVVANYRVYEDFNETFNDYIFSKFKVSTGGSFKYVKDPESNISYAEIGSNTKVTRNFERITTKTEFAFKAYFDGSSQCEFSIGAENVNGLCFKVDGDDIYFDDEKIATASNKSWSDVNLVIDLPTHQADIKINNKIIKQYLPIDNNITYFDQIVLETQNGFPVNVDDIKVHTVIDYEIPLIAMPPISDKHTIGITSTPYWENGAMSGWGPITAFNEIEPLLGYYDEGSSQVADWENKFLVEHGVDFQVFSWFYRKTDGPIKDGAFDKHISAYLNSKTTSFVNMAIMYEAEENNTPSTDEFKQYLIPYWVEHFISQPCYMKMNERPIFVIHNVEILTHSNTAINLAECIQTLRDAVRAAGLANPIVLAASNPKEDLSFCTYGFDATYAYNFGAKGFSHNYTEFINEEYFRGSDVYHIPTVSVGKNTLGYSGIRNPLMTSTDFRHSLNYARYDYIPTHGGDSPLDPKFLMLSNWNDYGNGTYLMPTKSFGFKYLDIVREVFTNGGNHDDFLPTAEEKQEFTHTYPQNIRTIRDDGRYIEPLSNNALNYKFTSDSEVEIDDFMEYDPSKINKDGKDKDGTKFEILDTDASFSLKDVIFKDLRAEDIRSIMVVMSGLPSYEGLKLYYTTENSPIECEEQSIERFSASVNETIYSFDFFHRTDFNGKIKSLSIHPGESSRYMIHFKNLIINFKNGYRKVIVNNFPVTFHLVPELNDNVFFVPFEPSENHLDRFLYTYYDWNAGAEILHLYRDGHKFSFKMGKDYATVDDSTRVELGNHCTLANGVPYLPLKALITLFDNYNYHFSIDFDFDNYTANIITPEAGFFPGE